MIDNLTWTYLLVKPLLLTASFDMPMPNRIPVLLQQQAAPIVMATNSNQIAALRFTFPKACRIATHIVNITRTLKIAITPELMAV